MNKPPLNSSAQGHNTPLLLPQPKQVDLLAPFRWLKAGARDMQQAPWLGSLHGLAIALFGGTLLLLAHDRFWLLAGAFSGFLVVAPVLATSLYAISRALERHEEVNFSLVIKTWTRWQHSRFVVRGGYWCLVRFGLLLAMAGTGWVLTSAALITLMAPAPINTPADFFRHVVLAPDHYLFELWLTMGGLMAAPIFASSVIAMPLLLDRRVNVLQAVLSSWQVVLTNPAPLAVWAAIIMLLTALAFGTFLVGFVFLLPLIGHASWHAYKDLLDTQGLVERLPPEGVI